MSTTTTLTRTDLRGFDKRATDLILTAIEAGCTGRVSSKGHVILHNRTGQIASVPRDLSKPNRTGANAVAAVSRLIAAQNSEPETDRADTDVSCPDCGRTFNGPMSLMSHQKGAHGREATIWPTGTPSARSRPSTTCRLAWCTRVCDRPGCAPGGEPTICRDAPSNRSDCGCPRSGIGPTT